MKTRLSIDTHFETYRAIIARTKNFISDDDFIVHRGDINNPGFYITVLMESQSHFLQEPQSKKKSVTPIMAITPDIRPGNS
jgi:hypothetical protein